MERPYCVVAFAKAVTQVQGIAAVVSHETINRLLLLSLLGLPRRAFSQIRQDPSCLNVLVRRRSGWEIALLNDLSHLKLCSDD